MKTFPKIYLMLVTMCSLNCSGWTTNSNIEKNDWRTT